MSNIDLYIEGSCKTNELDIPASAQIYTIQSNGVGYCGISSKLEHVYRREGTLGYMTTILLESQPTLKPMKSDETLVITSATYHGLLTTIGLIEQLERPISHYYSPPLVDIVMNENGDVRAIIVDATYAIQNHHDFETLENIRQQIFQCQQKQEYWKSTKIYHNYKQECIKLAKDKTRTWR